MQSMTNTIKYSEFNPANLKFTKLEEKNNGQLMAYPRYNKNNMEISEIDIQLPWINIYAYGIPQLGKYYKSDDDRAHLRLPLDLNNPEICDLVEKLKGLDKIYSSQEMMENILGKKAKKYKYQSIYREAVVVENDSDDEDQNTKKKSGPKPSYIKLKLKLSYPDKKIESKVFESELDPKTNKYTRTQITTNTIDEFANYARYLSTVRCVIRPFKMWAQDASKKDPEFGISLRIERLEVDKSSINGIYKSVYASDTFIDDDEEDILPKNILQFEQIIENKKLKNEDTIVEIDSDDSDDSDDDSDNDEDNNENNNENNDEDNDIKIINNDIKSIIVDEDSDEDSDDDSDDENNNKKKIKLKENKKVLDDKIELTKSKKKLDDDKVELKKSKKSTTKNKK